MAAGSRALPFLLTGVAALALVAVTVFLVNKSWRRPDELSRNTRASSYVTLRGGTKPWEGELVWRSNDNALCIQSLTQNDADVICKSLFPDRPIQHGVIHDASQLTGQPAQGFVSLANFGCSGAEGNIDECPRPSAHNIPAVNCPTGAAALTCEAVTPVSDNVRLVGGTATQGRLELNFGGNWSSVCDLALDTKLSRLEVRPICKTLGYWYSTPSVSAPGEFGEGTGDLVTSVPQCTGDEPDISYCSFRPLGSSSICNHTADAGIRCTIPTMTSSAIQLNGFSNQPWKGAVVIHEPGSQLTTGVCGDRWNDSNTAITCKTAGFKYGGVQLNSMPVAGLQPRVRLDRLECKGQEATLANCPGYDIINSFQCGPGAGLSIASIDCSGGYTARLVSPNNTETAGAVEVYLPATKQWVGVLTGGLDQLAARTVCSTIRYPDTQPVVLTSSFGSNTTLANLNCSSLQDHVSQCVIPTPAATTQPHAAVRCFGCGSESTSEEDSIPVMTGMTVDTDCMYVINPQGDATLYKLWFDDVLLNGRDLLDVRETPAQDPAGLSLGPSRQGPFVLFKDKVYVRVKASNNTGHSATLKWAPITVETVTSLTCSDDDMKIRVNITELSWLYNDTNPAYISLVNEGCTGHASGHTWAIDNPHSQCYTQRQIDGDYVHYRNALIYKEQGAGPIVREHRWRVDLYCNLRRQMQVGLDYHLTDVNNYELNLKSDYRAEIHLYNDSSLETELHSSQIKARLGDDLYVNIVLKGQWNVTMHLQECVARPEPGSDTSYTLIQDGCATDSQTFIVYTTHNSTLFHFKAFEFYSGFSTVYIYCSVAYCAPFDNSARCSEHCN